MYSKKVMQHFMHPKNVGVIKNADGIGKAGNVVCGDIMLIYIKVEKNKIRDIKFRTLGCVAALATSSVITEIAKNKTIEQALKITKINVAKRLGGLPPLKMHCSVLATEALSEAIYNYMRRNKLKIPKEIERRHTEVIKETEEVKKRYKKFVEEQEKIFKK